MSNTTLNDGVAVDMGDGCYVIMQQGEGGVVHSVFITAQDRARMDAADQARAA